MQRLNPWQSYRRVATSTATPGQLVLMLYDGAVRFLEQACTGFSKEDPLEFNQTINNNVLRAQAIINEMNSSLNMEAGGQLSQTLRDLYNYFDRKLQESNQHKQEAGIKEVIRRLETLRDAWAQMLSESGPESAEQSSRLVALG